MRSQGTFASIVVGYRSLRMRNGRAVEELWAEGIFVILLEHFLGGHMSIEVGGAILPLSLTPLPVR